MMGFLWVVLFVALTSAPFGQGLPLRSTPEAYPHDTNSEALLEAWRSKSGLYGAVPALALVLTAVGLLFGCTWCYRHKDCKPNEGAENQLFTASATHLHDARRSQPPDSGFSEPANNNITEDNNNGPISLREMQNIANNNAAAYIISENEERNRVSRESVVEFEPLPSGIPVADPLERCADWFAGEDLPRNRLQYLREIGRGWFGRVVEGEIEDEGTTTVAVKILNQNASLEDKARFLDESKLYRDVTHENILAFIAKCLQEDPWILMFELCSMDLQQYLIHNRPKMAILNESGVPLQLMCDVASALSYLHSRGHLYGNVSSSNILVRYATSTTPRAVVGSYAATQPPYEFSAPETRRHPPVYTTSSEIWSLGTLIWEMCTWAAPVSAHQPPPPDLPCPYRNHLYQVMQLCWNPNAEARPTSSQVHALLEHLHSTHTHTRTDDGDFEQRWQTLKPNTIPKIDEHVALVHAPSTSMASHFTSSEQDLTPTALSTDMDTAVSRSSSIMSDRDPLSVQIRSESLNNLHGSLEDVRNIYLTHNETATLECHQGNMSFEEREQDKSDSSVDPWVKDLIAGSQDDVSYYRDVSDVIKNLDNILNSEKTSSSESSHQASPSRDNLSLDCKKDFPIQSSMVKSPGITNFKNILEIGFDETPDESCNDDEIDRDTVGTLSHSFERHSDTISQHTLENLTPDTPIKDFDLVSKIESNNKANQALDIVKVEATVPPHQNTELPKEYIDISDSEIPKNDLYVASLSSVSENEQLNLKDCVTSCDNLVEIVRTQVEPKSVDNTVNNQESTEEECMSSEKQRKGKLEPDLKGVEINDNTQTDVLITVENAILPDCLTEIAANIIENEVIQPAIQIVSNILEKEELKKEEAKQNEELPPRLIVRENHEIITPSNNSIEEITNTLIEEERRFSEKLEVEESSQKVNLFETENDLKVSFVLLQENVQDISSVNKPDLVQISESTIETENAKVPIPSNKQAFVDNLPEEELLAFSSNFADINLEVINEMPSTLSPQIVQNNVTEKAETPLLVNMSSEIHPSDLVQNIATEEATNRYEKNDVMCSVNIATTYQALPVESLENVIDVADQDLKVMKTENNVKLTGINEKNTDFLELGKEKSLKNAVKELKAVSNDVGHIFDELSCIKDRDKLTRSDKEMTEKSTDSTAYMDLINCTNSETNNSEKVQDNVKECIKSCLNKSFPEDSCSLIKNDSTVYLDLPNIIKHTSNFLNSERITSQEDKIYASTPKGSECSAENTLESPLKNENTIVSETKLGELTAIAKSEQKFIADLLSPFDSPTKSHPTDTYDENSSVVLGPFENCVTDCKNVKAGVELPKEELFAFSSNFSEINLETPSPLRDGNFLNEVPDIAGEDFHYEDVTLSESKKDLTDKTDETDQSATTKRISPSTPPNSPGIYLASTSQQKYLIDIDLETPENQSYPPIETDSGLSSLQKEIDLNQIELQITTKLAMAENENNMNIEYSGPLTVEGLVSEDDAILRESNAIPEAFLAGNGGAFEDRSEGLSLDEECVQALRNELELKLPLAQVAGIEPASVGGDAECDSEVDAGWGELPPPPELVVHYGMSALSPIAEETCHQLTQYENDAWNPSTRTESSESYPEPCNDSTAEVTDLPTGAVGSNEHTYTIYSKNQSINDTYTVQKDIPTSRELTMSADSLNGSPYKKPLITPHSPTDDRTFIKNEDEKLSNCEIISQVSPFLMSPTTDTSGPDSVDNATGVSTLSKTTVPTDAKHSKPSECLSKATSIDSWCSNDTLYNVEENFDDLVMEADIPELDSEMHELAKSASTNTLTHQEDEKETTQCSTYIVHDSKSEVCETFSPDSITGNDYTYTKVKTDATGVSPSIVTKSDVNDSTKSQTKDLAYGTLPSYSNCTTQVMSGMVDPWKLPQPELVRRSPTVDDVILTPPRVIDDNKSLLNDSPQTTDASIRKMDSVELSCLQDDINSHKSESSESQLLIDMERSVNSDQIKNNMVPSFTSTPLAEPLLDDSNIETYPMNFLPDSRNSESLLDSVPNFNNLIQSAEIRPQDTTCNQDTALLLEGNSKTLSDSIKYSMVFTKSTPNFENSTTVKPEIELPVEKSSQNIESGMSSGDFRQFENSIKACPQDLSSVIDVNSLFLNSERHSSELATNSNMGFLGDLTSQSSISESTQNLNTNPPNTVNLVESQHIIPNISFSMYVTDLDEEETDQPHSIIFTEVSQAPKNIDKKFKDSDIKTDNYNDQTFDSHTEIVNSTYDSHAGKSSELNTEVTEKCEPKSNGVDKIAVIIDNSKTSTQPAPTESFQSKDSIEAIMNDNKEVINSSITEVATNMNEVICNGDSQNYAIVNFINESFEVLPECNNKITKQQSVPNHETEEFAIAVETPQTKKQETNVNNESINEAEEKMAAVTADFLQKEKDFCTADTYIPMLNDIRFTGPASEIMSTSFTQESPTEPEPPECEQNGKADIVSDIIKEWDSDSESHSSNSSSGEFIWKDGDGHETPVVPTTHFDHQQEGCGGQPPAEDGGKADGAGSEASGDSGSGSEGDEVEFIPSSWDCRAAPAKSSLRSIEQQPPTDKKRVVFKRQKYHCVYEYPRELADVETHSPGYLPDLSTYCEWDPTSAEEAELGYGQLYGTTMDMYQLRSGIAFGSDYDDDFFISSSARPFESLGIMSTSSQFFPGMHMKPSLVDRDSDDVTEDFLPAPPPPPPLVTSITHTRAPSLDFTTPDSGVEDITPGSTSTDEDFKTKKLDTEVTQAWKPIDSASSSESVSPSSPGGEALGGLRHTRDKLKLDLPPSPHIPSPRHNRVFNFVLDKPKRHRAEAPLVLTDDTPVATSTLPIEKHTEDVPVPEPTFSTFGKCKTSVKDETENAEQKIILTDETDEASPTTESKEETPAKSESVKGEGTVLDSGDEDSGIESSSKASLERKANVL